VKRRAWTSEEDAVMRARYPDVLAAQLATALRRSVRSVYQRAQTLGLGKSSAYLSSPQSGRLQKGAGAATRFVKGHAPHNKGVRRPGWAPGRMGETQFRPGERRGVAVRLYKPIGTERVSKDGYLERKINDDLPLQRRWRAVHLLVWEEANGPLPAGHAVAFRNGNKRDIRLDNLELISRRALMRRNTVHNLPKPVAQAVQLLGAVRRQINRRERAAQH
jgi:hypothetical protein